MVAPATQADSFSDEMTPQVNKRYFNFVSEAFTLNFSPVQPAVLRLWASFCLLGLTTLTFFYFKFVNTYGFYVTVATPDSYFLLLAGSFSGAVWVGGLGWWLVRVMVGWTRGVIWVLGLSTVFLMAGWELWFQLQLLVQASLAGPLLTHNPLLYSGFGWSLWRVLTVAEAESLVQVLLQRTMLTVVLQDSAWAWPLGRTATDIATTLTTLLTQPNGLWVARQYVTALNQYALTHCFDALIIDQDGGDNYSVYKFMPRGSIVSGSDLLEYFGVGYLFPWLFDYEIELNTALVAVMVQITVKFWLQSLLPPPSVEYYPPLTLLQPLPDGLDPKTTWWYNWQDPLWARLAMQPWRSDQCFLVVQELWAQLWALGGQSIFEVESGYVFILVAGLGFLLPLCGWGYWRWLARRQSSSHGSDGAASKERSSDQ